MKSIKRQIKKQKHSVNKTRKTADEKERKIELKKPLRLGLQKMVGGVRVKAGLRRVFHSLIKIRIS